MSLHYIIQNDLKAVSERLGETFTKTQGSTWLISGGGGFIGAYLLDIIDYFNREVFKTPSRAICIDNFISGTPERLRHLQNNQFIKIVQADIVQPLNLTEKIDYIIHAASIASPVFYRQYPIETIETNVLGLKNLLDLAVRDGVKSFLYFSTSEIYGNPPPEYIPTREDYNGNVSCTGPRACYDESKRLGETLCVNYCKQRGVPVKIVRPFNVYGPELKIDDKRVIPDFFNDALYRKEITVLSNGAPTRSFCYIEDALDGFVTALLSEYNGEAFNIGNDDREITMYELAGLISEIVGGVDIRFKQSADQSYLTDNPQRRRPDLTKARTLLGYSPRVSLEQGLERILKWYRGTYQL